jgi:hypothetical protein
MNLERAPQIALSFRLVALLAQQRSQLREALRGFGMRVAEDLLGHLRRLAECLHGLRVASGSETHRSQFAITSGSACAIRLGFGVLATQDVGNILLGVGVAAQLDLDVEHSVLRPGPQPAIGSDLDCRLRALPGFHQFPLTALREFQTEEHLRAPDLGMTALSKRDRKLLLRFGPVARVQVPLAFGCVQMTLPVPLPYMRFGPARYRMLSRKIRVTLIIIP